MAARLSRTRPEWDGLDHRAPPSWAGMTTWTWSRGRAGRFSARRTSSSRPGAIENRRAAPDGNLAVPPAEIPLDARQPLPAARVPEPAHALDQRRLERGGVAPAVAEPLGLRGLERAAEAEPGVADGDHDDPAPESLAEVIQVDGDPSGGPRMLHNILTCLRKRHRESHRGLGLEPELIAQHPGGPLLDPSDHLVHVLRCADRRDVEQVVRRVAGGSARHLAVNLEEVGGVAEEPRLGPVAPDLVAGGDGEERLFPVGFPERLGGDRSPTDPAEGGPGCGASTSTRSSSGQAPKPWANWSNDRSSKEGRHLDPSSRHQLPAKVALPGAARREGGVAGGKRMASPMACGTGAPASRRTSRPPRASPQPVGSRRPPSGRRPARCGPVARPPARPHGPIRRIPAPPLGGARTERHEQGDTPAPSAAAANYRVLADWASRPR